MNAEERPSRGNVTDTHSRPVLARVPADERPDPFVTVVVPTRERADYLLTSLRSILVAADEARRAGWGVRVLVVDDVSPTTATREVAEQLGVDYVRLDKHDGQNNPASAMAYGVSMVTSPFLAFFGDDDIMLPRHLVSHLELVEAGYDLVTCSFVRTDATLREIERRTLPEPHLGDLLDGKIMINDSAMVRTELAQRAPWDPSLGQVVLYPVWLTIMTEGVRATRIVEPGSLYRRHQENISDLLPPEDQSTREAIAEKFRAAIIASGRQVPWSRARQAEAQAEAMAQYAQWQAERRAAELARAKEASWAALPARVRGWRRVRRRAGSAVRQVAGRRGRAVITARRHPPPG